MTARKTTPHLKRGPKPKPKPPKRAKGRPEVRLRDHPDRYTVARFDVADTWLKKLLKGTRTRATAVQTIDVLREESPSLTRARLTCARSLTCARPPTTSARWQGDTGSPTT